MKRINFGEPTPLVYSIRTAAEVLTISERHLATLIKHGKIPVLRLGKRVVIPIAELHKWVAEQGKAAA